MTIRATRLTPEVLLGVARISGGVPNSDATYVLHQKSIHSLEQERSTKQIQLLELKTNDIQVVLESDNAHSPKWLDDDDIIVFVAEKGQTRVVIGEPKAFETNNYTAGTINAAIGDIKIVKTAKNSHALAFSAPTNSDGSLHNSECQKESLSTGRLYNSTFVRHWDKWTTNIKTNIWISTLTKSTESSGRFVLGQARNLLEQSGLECPIYPFGGSDNYDLSTDHLAFVAKDPHVKAGFNTKQNLYIIDLANPADLDSSKPIIIPGFEGATSNPVFSQDGKFLALTSMHLNGYESDKNQIFIFDIENRAIRLLYSTDDKKGSWDRSPSTLTWSLSGKHLFAKAEEHGREKLFSIRISNRATSQLPVPMYSGGSISGITVLEAGIFITATSFTEDCAYHLMPDQEGVAEPLWSNSAGGVRYGISNSQISEVHFPGAQTGIIIQTWVLKPSNFEHGKTYPMAYIIHGGPQGAWTDGWSYRWNPMLYTEQGYVVILPNPTGSTGFGQKFTDDIQGQWGGLAYEDLVRGFDYVKKTLKYVDVDRAVALGASYGGYMMNWIQGNELGRRFKALVTHDGAFSLAGLLATEEVYFPNHEFGDSYWKNRQQWEQWDPARFVQHWDTPHLILHSEQDFRLNIVEGLAAFNVLQERGIESQFLTFPDENHWVLKPINSLLWHTVVLDFINAKVGLALFSEQSKLAKKLKDAAQVN